MKSKKAKYIIGASVFGAALLATVVFLIIKAVPKNENNQLTQPEIRTIEKKVLATGTILPRVEVAVKSPTSGVVGEIFIQAGDFVDEGDPLFSIKAVPNSLELNSAEAAFERSRIQLTEAEAQYQRARNLYAGKILSEVEYLEAETAYLLASQNYDEARNRILLLKEGRTDSGSGNIVYAPIAGTILSLPLKQGAPVQASGSYSEGTTVVYMADMATLYFDGSIDEAQVGNLETGLPVKINIAALDDDYFEGTLSFISPRGNDNSGTVMFPIEIELTDGETSRLRAGYSASAEVILLQSENALSIMERDILFRDGAFYVEVLQGKDYQQKEVKLGISDGIFTEVLSGISESDQIKIQ